MAPTFPIQTHDPFSPGYNEPDLEAELAYLQALVRDRYSEAGVDELTLAGLLGDPLPGIEVMREVSEFVDAMTTEQIQEQAQQFTPVSLPDVTGPSQEPPGPETPSSGPGHPAALGVVEPASGERPDGSDPGEQTGDFEPAQGDETPLLPADATTAKDILGWVGDDPARALAALDAEAQREKPRSVLTADLERIVDKATG